MVASCEMKKTGGWKKMGEKLVVFPIMAEQQARQTLNSAAEMFQKEIRKSILNGNVHPESGDFSSDEYASRVVNIPVGQNQRFVGIMKGTAIQSRVIDSDVVSLEYEDKKTLGTWRKTITRFERKWDTAVNRKFMSNLLRWWDSV